MQRPPRTPQVKLATREIIWITYFMAKGLTSTQTRELVLKDFKLRNDARSDWRNYIREVLEQELQARPPMGGVGQEVQIDETRLRGKRKANRGRLLTGDAIPPRHRNNYGGVAHKGPWVFGMVWSQTGELRLFQVEKRDAATLGPIIAANIMPGTTVYSDEWAAYNCIPSLQDRNGAPLNLDWHTINHTTNFVDPLTGANTQRIESAWQKVKRKLVWNGQKTSRALLQSHLSWQWWQSINGRTKCQDPFLRLMEAIARRYPL
ncbi:uncharacterized protein LOC144134927 [Amblyomma americanum]